MELHVVPRPSEAELAAVERALVRTGIRLDAPDAPAAVYASAWRRAAVREAVESFPARPSYARSPRSTRGATRA